MNIYECESFLSDELFKVSSMFDMYIELYNARISHLDALNIAYGFFQATTDALLENSTLRLCKMFDKNTDTVTLYKLVNILQSDPKTHLLNKKELPEIIKQCRKILDDLLPYIEKLRDLRDSSLAHNDSKYCFQDAFTKVGLVIGDYHLVIGNGLLVLNLVRKALGMKQSAIFIEKFDVAIVVDALDGYIKEHPEYIEEAERRRNSFNLVEIKEA